MWSRFKQYRWFNTMLTLPIEVGAVVVLALKMHQGTADSRTAAVVLFATAVFLASVAQDRHNQALAS